ncbi:MAG: galactokinase [Clostridia bacterium]|nr:galactokinase [Clostridia bacterium]
MNTIELTKAVRRGTLDTRLAALYGKEALELQRARYAKAIDEFAALYGAEREISLFSVAGRSELSGNHTDHNLGCVIAASIDLDIIAVASPTNSSVIRVKSERFPEDTVDISTYNAPRPERFSHSDSIIAGMCAGLLQKGWQVGGFDAYTTSSVLKGSGLSSSAAFEDMIGNIENHLYNDGKIDNVEIAKIAQYAENEFFGKPCGLMDQTACAVGGIVAIDFADPKSPIVEKMAYDITAAGYNLCIVNTGGNHADLTPDYAAIPTEMKAVAAAMGKKALREVCEADVIAAIPELRKTVGDRAILRALHFFAENARVAKQKQALRSGDLEAFFENVTASGRSSFCYLQNVYTPRNPEEQGLSLALCLAEQYLSDKKGACRVHGGGFAGTVQAFLRTEDVAGFRALMDGVFGEGACIVLRIRSEGATRID